MLQVVIIFPFQGNNSKLSKESLYFYFYSLSSSFLFWTQECWGEQHSRCHPSCWSEDLFYFNFHSVLSSCFDSTFCTNFHSVSVSSFIFPLNVSVTLSLLLQYTLVTAYVQGQMQSVLYHQRRFGVRVYDLGNLLERNKFILWNVLLSVKNDYWIYTDFTKFYFHFLSSDCQMEGVIILWGRKRYWLIDHDTLTFLESSNWVYALLLTAKECKRFLPFYWYIAY